MLLLLRLPARGHVKLWAPNRQADITATVGGTRRRQAIACRNNSGCGFFGVKFRSDATARFNALEDHQISIDLGTDVEVVGVEVTHPGRTTSTTRPEPANPGSGRWFSPQLHTVPSARSACTVPDSDDRDTTPVSPGTCCNSSEYQSGVDRLHS